MENGHARVAVLGKQGKESRNRPGVLDRHDIRARDHDLGHARSPKPSTLRSIARSGGDSDVSSSAPVSPIALSKVSRRLGALAKPRLAAMRCSQLGDALVFPLSSPCCVDIAF